MKTTLHLLLLTLTALALSNCGAGVAEIKPARESHSGVLPGIHAPRTLHYRGQSYTAGYSGDGKSGAIVEYYKPGENPNGWSSMLALRILRQPTTPDAQAKALASTVSAKGLRSLALKNEKTGEASLDFMLPHSTGLEFNIFRYRPLAGAQGVQSFQYVENVSNARLRTLDGKAYAQAHRETFLPLAFPAISNDPAN